jgi:hypothetical protein
LGISEALLDSERARAKVSRTTISTLNSPFQRCNLYGELFVQEECTDYMTLCILIPEGARASFGKKDDVVEDENNVHEGTEIE